MPYLKVELADIFQILSQLEENKLLEVIKGCVEEFDEWDTVRTLHAWTHDLLLMYGELHV